MSKIKVGDTVLIKQPKSNKLSSPFFPVPALLVEEKNRPMVTACDRNTNVTRNSSMFKVVPSHIKHAEKVIQEWTD